MKLKQVVQDYLERTKIYKRRGTYDYYVKISKALYKAFDYLGYETSEDLTIRSLDEIVLYYKKQTIKKNSQINADISFFYTVLNYYHIENKMPKFEKLPDDTTSFRPLSDKLLDKFIKYLRTLDLNESNNLSWVLSMYLMLDTGVRMNELLNIKTKNIDLISNSIILERTKNGKKRVVFFDVLSRDVLIKAMKKKKEYIIWNYNKNEPMNRVAIFYFMNKVFANVESDSKIHAHRLRKTFATRLLKEGCPLTTIQKLLGHSDIKMTMKYLEIDISMIEKDYFTFYPYKNIIKKAK
jgi:integrase